jgi:hypothetical protein
MTLKANARPGMLHAFLIRFHGSFLFRAAISGGLFFFMFTTWMAVSPPPGSRTLADPIVLPALALGSAAFGLFMSWFAGLLAAGRRVRVLEAEVARLRSAATLED